MRIALLLVAALVATGCAVAVRQPVRAEWGTIDDPMDPVADPDL